MSIFLLLWIWAGLWLRENVAEVMSEFRYLNPKRPYDLFLFPDGGHPWDTQVRNPIESTEEKKSCEDLKWPSWQPAPFAILGLPADPHAEGSHQNDASQGSRRTTWPTHRIIRNNKSGGFFFLIKNKATKVWRGLYVAIGHWYIVCESSISSTSLWLSSISGIAAYPSHLSSSEESENTKVWIFVFWFIHTFQLLLAYLIASKICSWGLEFWISNVNHFWSSEKA